VTFAQAVAAASSNPEPIVTGALVTAAGLVILWFAQKVLWLVKTMQSVMTALFGDMNVSEHERNGALKQLAGVDRRLMDHTTEFATSLQDAQTWQRQMYDAIHKWNENTTLMLKEVTPIEPAPLQLPPPIERRKKMRDERKGR
jgi:hypothetical protein